MYLYGDLFYTVTMVVKILVLIFGILQVPAAAYLSIGTFEESERLLPVFIQPAGWAFSIWGLIFTLSVIYSIYQAIPQYDNQLLRHTRVPALIAFTGSIAWLFFAGLETGWVWLTIPILFAMSLSLTRVTTVNPHTSRWSEILSVKVLLPYAAWTAVASWLNIQALLVDRGVVTSDVYNTVLSLVLFIGIVSFTWYFFRKSHFSVWYGGVLIWASAGVVFANVYQYNNWAFALLAGIFIIVVLIALRKNLTSL
jgi:hypothetical protein